MELNFVETIEGKEWVAEFEAPSDFNLHIERKESGSLVVGQRGTASGEYDTSFVMGMYEGGMVIDYDFGALVYPKWIKVTSSSEVVNGYVNFNEGGGSGSGSSDDVKWEYYKIDWDKFEETNDYESLPTLVCEADAFNVSYWGSKYVTTAIGLSFADYTYSKIAGTNKAMFVISKEDGYAHETNEGSWIKNIQIMYPNINTSFIVPITKDEFLIFDDNEYRNIVDNGPI